MRIAIRRIGNFKGMIIPTAMLQQAGLALEADVSVEDGALVVPCSEKKPYASAGRKQAQSLQRMETMR